MPSTEHADDASSGPAHDKRHAKQVQQAQHFVPCSNMMHADAALLWHACVHRRDKRSCSHGTVLLLASTVSVLPVSNVYSATKAT
jgi:hypothetical protein